MTESLPFAQRVFFAFVCFFRVLFDGVFAGRVRSLARGELPAAEPTPALRAPEPEPEAPAKPEAPAPPATDAALQLLGLLQREGRFVDFIEQDVESFSDTDIGAAARVVHAGCRRALHEHLRIAPVRTEDEGSAVTVPEGFDPAAIKLTGNVAGAAPYRGTLRHRGWKAESIHLPERVGDYDVSVLAPAEVEL